MEEASPCRGSGTNAACAPLLVLRESSSPPCPVTEVAWADSSCSASPRGTALRQSGSPSLLSEFWAAGFPRPGGLLADRNGTAVGPRPFGLSTSLCRGSSVEPCSSFFLASERVSRPSQTSRCLLAARHLSGNHSSQPANRRAWSGSTHLGEPSRVATGVFRLSSEEGFREDRGCCRLTSLLTQRRDRHVSNQNKSTFRNSHRIHLTYKQLWITKRRCHRSAFGAAKVRRRSPVARVQARKKRKLTVAGKLEGNVRLCSACISSPASAAMASKTGISKMYWSEKPCVAS